MRLLLCVVVLAGCHETTGAPDGAAPVDLGGDAARPDAYPPGTAALGMNDVSILVPLPSSPGVPVLLAGTDLVDDGQPLLSRALWDRLITDASGMPEVFVDFRALQVMAVRFDLCDRRAPGACPADSDGQLRLVMQPFDAVIGAEDVSIHVLYTVPRAELAAMVGELRGLAAMATGARAAPLQPSPTLLDAPSGPYADRLRALVRNKALGARLRRLTFLSQPSTLSSIHWEMRGLDWNGSELVDLVIPGVQAARQGATLMGTTSFELSPLVDQPSGLALAVSSTSFAAASDAQRRAALAALASIENPLSSTADTVQCASCHVATISMHRRLAESGLTLADVAGRYTSNLDLSIAAGASAKSDRTMRMFGWLGRQPFIGQRVANDSAQAVLEIEAGYPAP